MKGNINLLIVVSYNTSNAFGHTTIVCDTLCTDMNK